MDIKVMGPGCSNCAKLEEIAKSAIKELNLDINVEKVSDMLKISEAGIMLTPGLVINGKVKHSGKPLPSLEKVISYIKEEMEG